MGTISTVRADFAALRPEFSRGRQSHAAVRSSLRPDMHSFDRVGGAVAMETCVRGLQGSYAGCLLWHVGGYERTQGGPQFPAAVAPYVQCMPCNARIACMACATRMPRNACVTCSDRKALLPRKIASTCENQVAEVRRTAALREARQSIPRADASTLWDGSRSITFPDAELEPTPSFRRDHATRRATIH